jgi:hypothetical protein
MSSHLERALAAEDQVETLKDRVADLESRLRGALNSDPTTAVKAMSWMHRAENGEQLIKEAALAVKRGEIKSTDLPSGWLARAEAQIAALEILGRDQAELMGEPGDESWEKMRDGQIRVIDL